ncbi:Suppressor of variegation 2-10 [Operophtera brumata]|uniref:Suppressor of variegation 2-10 n=1 Tax=Operophtera brumata TaxID=104452 RepID=A0A0L7LLD7_OPEBR|nr:Suppressor of variegation 2-10 [Operophtera brumata]
MKPSTMMPMQQGRMQEGTYAQLRFCLLESSCEQEDHFPPSNPIPTNKPTPEPKRPPRPVNISSLVKLSPTVANQIHVTWAADFTRAYVLIKEKLSEDYDSEIATTSLRVSLMCPLGKMRMSCPCRPAACPHLQCFDASLFLQMNERKPTWLCPVCDRPAPYDSLEVLASPRLPSDCNEIQLLKDGSWAANTPAPRVPQQQQQQTESSVTLISDDLEVIPVDSGDRVGGSDAKLAAVGEDRTPKPADAMVDLTSDSEDELPLKRKAPPPKGSPPETRVIKNDDSYSSSGKTTH